MASQFGDKIRGLRTSQKLLLRQVASALDMDTALLSKIERGERPIKKEQITNLSEVLKGDKEELLTLWIADKVYDIVKDEEVALKALLVTEGEIKKFKKKKR